MQVMLIAESINAMRLENPAVKTILWFNDIATVEYK